MNRKTLAPLAVAAALLALTGSASAQATIDHKKALAGNVTPGDTAGYPITLSVPGHYKLMSNLMVPESTVGVLIQTNGVTLDLNGFTIGTARACSFNLATFTTTCPNSGGHRGIDSSSHALTVRNGTVSGFAHGVWLSGGLVENVTVRNNHVGILITDSRPTRVTGALAEFNSGSGISVDLAAMIDNTVVARNTIGIDAKGTTIVSVRDSAIYYNSLGMRDGAIRSTHVGGNKANLFGTAAY